MDNSTGVIKVESKFNFIKLEKIEIKLEPNEHGFAEIVGIVEENTEELVVSTNDDSIKIIDISKDNLILFSGVIDEIKLKYVNNVNYITIKALTNSIKLDIKKKKRSFQNKESPYKKIFDEIVKKDHKGGYIDCCLKEEKQKKVFIQYEETDWAFLKRVTSQLNEVLIPDAKGERVQIHVGTPILSTEEEKEYNYEIEKLINRFENARENESAKYDLDYVNFKIKSNHYYDIGVDIYLKSIKFTVSKVEITINHDEIIRQYTLTKRDGIKTLSIKNDQLIGTSLDGKTIAVKGDEIKVHLSIDKEQKESEANWFKFGTSYTTEGETGLYVMPKKEDSVKLYLVDTDETNGFIKCINRSDGKSNTKTSNTKTKYFGNDKGKELKLDEKELKITSQASKVFIKMEDAKGITIECDKKIKITSKDYIEIKGKKIKLKAEEAIQIKTDEASIVLNNITHIRGDKIKTTGFLKS